MSDSQSQIKGQISKKKQIAGKKENPKPFTRDEQPARGNRQIRNEKKGKANSKTDNIKADKIKADNIKEGKPCPYTKKCGGCALQGMPYAQQLQQKKHAVAKLFEGIAKPEATIGMENPYHYRNKVHAVFGYAGKGEIISGIYQEGTHKIVPIASCLIEDEKADAIISTIRNLLKSFRIKTYDEDSEYGLLRHVLVRCGRKTGEYMVVLVLASPILPSKNNFVKALLREHPEIKTVVLNVNDKRTSMVLGARNIVLYGKGSIEDELCGLRFSISPASFYQINPEQTEKLYREAIRLAALTGTERIIDAYCGIGTIGMAAAGQAGEVIGVELNPDAVRDAKGNAKKNQIQNARFFQGDAGEFMVQLAKDGQTADVVFMDPPRAGSSEAFLGAVAKLHPKRVVYISCNPETQVRDVRVLMKKGYRVKRLQPVDMFPFCRDVECIALLESACEMAGSQKCEKMQTCAAGIPKKGKHQF